MPELLLDPGFEEPVDSASGWTDELGTGRVEKETVIVRNGAESLRLRCDHNFSTFPGITEGKLSAVVPGEDYTISFWCRVDRKDARFHCLVQHYPNGLAGLAETIGTLESADLSTNNWTRFEFTASHVTTTASRLRFVPTSDAGPYLQSVRWYFDDASWPSDIVAIRLAERAVDNVVTTLLANLGTELAAIDADRADGITMAVPAAGDYFKQPRTEVAIGRPVGIEVYESAWDFEQRYSDAANANRATYRMPLTIKVTWFNRDGDGQAEMVTRGRRYVTGIFNVINTNRNIESTTEVDQDLYVLDVTPSWEFEEPQPGVFKGVAMLSAEAITEENP